MNISNLLKNFAQKRKTPLQLKFLYNYNKKKTKKNLVEQSKFLYNELSIRLSHRVFDLMKLPYGIPSIPEIKNVIHLYSESFQRIQLSKMPNNFEDIEHFTNLLENIKYRHNNLENNIAQGISIINNPLIDYSLIDNELNRFFISRIGIRTLISQQIETIKHNKNIFSKCNLKNIVINSIDNVNYLSEFTLENTPNIKINCKDDINLLYIENHLEYIITEILKNAYVAHDKFNSNEYIQIDVSEGKSDIIIKISDKGGGFKFNDIKNTLSFSYTTNKVDFSKIYKQTKIISGYGFGLPMSKLYAQYFGGDLFINPIENIGTDVFIYINKLGHNSEKLY